MKKMCTEEFANEFFAANGKPKGFKAAKLEKAALYDFDIEKGLYFVQVEYLPSVTSPNGLVVLDAVLKENGGDFLLADLTSDTSDYLAK